MSALADLEGPAAAGQALTRAEAERVAACPDLPSIGRLGELARMARHGNRVTYVRVLELDGPPHAGIEIGAAGELRLLGAPDSIEAARAWVRAAEGAGAGVLTGFSLIDLLGLVRGETGALAAVARDLRGEGLASLAEVPLDALVDIDAGVTALRAVADGGLGAWRATVTRAEFAERLDIIHRASAIQRQTSAFKSFAPLPQVDPGDQPSTGYDDVRTVALARLVCPEIPSIQVDWPLYGPKLAQVAIAFGADDIDRVPVASSPELGRRRSPREEIERHIRMAFAEPAERDGRFEIRA
jgi:aminodeoxyfutalosine synthase